MPWRGSGFVVIPFVLCCMSMRQTMGALIPDTFPQAGYCSQGPRLFSTSTKQDSAERCFMLSKRSICTQNGACCDGRFFFWVLIDDVCVGSNLVALADGITTTMPVSAPLRVPIGTDMSAVDEDVSVCLTVSGTCSTLEQVCKGSVCKLAIVDTYGRCCSLTELQLPHQTVQDTPMTVVDLGFGRAQPAVARSLLPVASHYARSNQRAQDLLNSIEFPGYGGLVPPAATNPPPTQQPPLAPEIGLITPPPAYPPPSPPVAMPNWPNPYCSKGAAAGIVHMAPNLHVGSNTYCYQLTLQPGWIKTCGYKSATSVSLLIAPFCMPGTYTQLNIYYWNGVSNNGTISPELPYSYNAADSTVTISKLEIPYDAPVTTFCMTMQGACNSPNDLCDPNDGTCYFSVMTAEEHCCPRTRADEFSIITMILPPPPPVYVPPPPPVVLPPPPPPLPPTPPGVERYWPEPHCAVKDASNLFKVLPYSELSTYQSFCFNLEFLSSWQPTCGVSESSTLQIKIDPACGDTTQVAMKFWNGVTQNGNIVSSGPTVYNPEDAVLVTYEFAIDPSISSTVFCLQLLGKCRSVPQLCGTSDGSCIFSITNSAGTCCPAYNSPAYIVYSRPPPSPIQPPSPPPSFPSPSPEVDDLLPPPPPPPRPEPPPIYGTTAPPVYSAFPGKATNLQLSLTASERIPARHLMTSPAVATVALGNFFQGPIASCNFIFNLEDTSNALIASNREHALLALLLLGANLPEPAHSASVSSAIELDFHLENGRAEQVLSLLKQQRPLLLQQLDLPCTSQLMVWTCSSEHVLLCGSSDNNVPLCCVGH